MSAARGAHASAEHLGNLCQTHQDLASTGRVARPLDETLFHHAVDQHGGSRHRRSEADRDFTHRTATAMMKERQAFAVTQWPP